MTEASETWTVYLIQAGDGSLYTGVTTDLERRLRQHQTNRGAKYLRGRGPLQVVLTESGYDRGGAQRREIQLKRLSRAEKLALIQQEN